MGLVPVVSDIASFPGLGTRLYMSSNINELVYVAYS